MSVTEEEGGCLFRHTKRIMIYSSQQATVC